MLDVWYPFVTIFACIFQIETLTLSFICTYNHAYYLQPFGKIY